MGHGGRQSDQGTFECRAALSQARRSDEGLPMPGLKRVDQAKNEGKSK
jgi:hypothetical protein